MAETQVMRVNGASIPASDIAIAQEITEIKTSPTFMELLKTTVEIKRQASEIKVRTDEDEKKAVESIAVIKRTSKALDDLRKEKVAFSTKFTQLVNKLFKDPQDDLKKARDTIEPRLDNYRREKQIAAQKEAERLRKEQERTQKKLEKAGIDIPMTEMPAPKPEKIVRSETASAHTQKRWTFEVEDKMALIKAVAEGKERPEALEINKTYIDGLISAGVREIPGLRIFQKDKTVVRT